MVLTSYGWAFLKDNQKLETQFVPLVEHSFRSLVTTGLLRGTPELIILDPTNRSRLRWLPEWQTTSSNSP